MNDLMNDFVWAWIICVFIIGTVLYHWTTDRRLKFIEENMEHVIINRTGKCARTTNLVGMKDEKGNPVNLKILGFEDCEDETP